MITIPQTFRDWEWYSDNNTRSLYLHLVFCAEEAARSWRGIEISRGQVVSSLSKLADDTGLSVRSIRTAISHLKGKYITISSANYGTVFTVLHYDRFYQPERQPTHQSTSDRQAETPVISTVCGINSATTDTPNGKRPTNGQKESSPHTPFKEAKVNNNIRAIYIACERASERVREEAKTMPHDCAEAWSAFWRMQLTGPKPIAEESVGWVLEDLEKYAPGDWGAKTDMLRQATIKHWNRVYPPDKPKAGTAEKTPTGRTTDTGNVFLEILNEMEAKKNGSDGYS